jgi:3-isopropylmalate/(R)-2-methylmalate dehydratase small subunit
VSLAEQTVATPAGTVHRFEVDAFRKNCLLNGWDDIGLTLKHEDKIRSFEAARLAAKPWLAHTMTESNP